MRSRIDPLQLVSQLASLIMDILAGKCENGGSEVRSRFSSRYTSEADLQKLSHALRILSEAEKQLRISKNQTTWFIAALLQLSSVDYPSMDADSTKLCLRGAYNGGTGEISYSLLARQEGHKRIIWSCSWNPHGHEFATGSRDKTVKIWGVERESSVRQLMTLPQFMSSVTALSWIGLHDQRNDGLLAIGMENGQIELWSLSCNRADDGSIAAAPGLAAALLVRVDPFICHASTVNRLAWRKNEEDHKSMQLASCGADNCVRVFDVTVE